MAPPCRRDKVTEAVPLSLPFVPDRANLSPKQRKRIATLRVHRGRRLCFGNAIFGGLAYFLECAHLDLPDALPRHVELHREVFQRHRLIGQMSRLEDTAFARVEDANRVV